MPYSNRLYQHIAWIVLVFSSMLISILAPAQSCPPNIDFETGTFDGWTCHTGRVEANSGVNVISFNSSGPPESGRHTMYSAGATTLVDPYGGFPVNCPNGSGKSIKLGNDIGGGQAEGISYEFMIPPGQNNYSLIYHYAVVFEDPNHELYQQPRMEIEILNVTDNVIVHCSSFTFVPFGTLLPGFFVSPIQVADAPIWCKNWSAVSVNLNNNAGKTFRLSFKTSDCTFRRHFGYAYIDVNSECNNEFLGAAFCPGDTTVTLNAPFGYQDYTWYNNTFSQVLSSDQTLVFNTPPTPGTVVAVVVVPYAGYGCVDTLYPKLIDTLTVTAHAGGDGVYCNDAVSIGSISKAGLSYNWSPALGLSGVDVSNPFASPDTTTKYILTVRSQGGGCMDTDTVLVRSVRINDSLQLIGSDGFCIGKRDSAILKVLPTDSIQWFYNNTAISGANNTAYRVLKTGNYYALLFNQAGCVVNTRQQRIVIDEARPGINYPLQYAVIDIPLPLEARSFGDTILWRPSSGLNNSQIVTPVFRSNNDQQYLIEIKTTSGCLTVDTQQVKIVKAIEIYVPTAFTPNKDGLNDILRPVFMGFKEVRFFRVFNRWGQLMFESRSGSSGWDGNFKGALQASDAFVWVVEGLGMDGQVYRRKGTTVLIR